MLTCSGPRAVQETKPDRVPHRFSCPHRFGSANPPPEQSLDISGLLAPGRSAGSGMRDSSTTTSPHAPAGDADGAERRSSTVDAWLDECFAAAEEDLFGPQAAATHRREQNRSPLFSAAFNTLAPVNSQTLLLRLAPASSPRPDSQLPKQAALQAGSLGNLNWWPAGQVRIVPHRSRPAGWPVGGFALPPGASPPSSMHQVPKNGSGMLPACTHAAAAPL